MTGNEVISELPPGGYIVQRSIATRGWLVTTSKKEALNLCISCPGLLWLKFWIFILSMDGNYMKSNFRPIILFLYLGPIFAKNRYFPKWCWKPIFDLVSEISIFTKAKTSNNKLQSVREEETVLTIIGRNNKFIVSLTDIVYEI